MQEETREEQQIGRKGRYKDKSKDSFFFLTYRLKKKMHDSSK